MRRSKAVFTGNYNDLIKASLAIAGASAKHYYTGTDTTEPILTVIWDFEGDIDVHDYMDIIAIEDAGCELRSLWTYDKS